MARECIVPTRKDTGNLKRLKSRTNNSTLALNKNVVKPSVKLLDAACVHVHHALSLKTAGAYVLLRLISRTQGHCSIHAHIRSMRIS